MPFWKLNHAETGVGYSMMGFFMDGKINTAYVCLRAKRKNQNIKEFFFFFIRRTFEA